MKLVKNGQIIDINGEDTAAGFIASGWAMIKDSAGSSAEDRVETADGVRETSGASSARVGRKRKTE